MTFQAITTKYFGPGNRRGSYIKAKAFAGSVSTEYDCALSLEANHAAAAKALADKFKWAGYWLGGGMPDGQGNVYVCANGKEGESISFHSSFHTCGEA